MAQKHMKSLSAKQSGIIFYANKSAVPQAKRPPPPPPPPQKTDKKQST